MGGVDLIVSVEAMGLPLLASVGNATGIPTVVIRKRSYGMDGENLSTYQLAIPAPPYSSTTSSCEKIVTVDDISTGTLEPLLKKLEDMGVILHDVVIAIEKRMVERG